MTSIEYLFNQLWDTQKDKFEWHAILDKAKQMYLQEMQHHIVDATKMITDFEIGIIAQQEATFAPSFIRGAEWYREQLLNRK